MERYGGAILLAIQIKEKVLLFLTRHMVFLKYENDQGQHGGSRNWLRGKVGMCAHFDDSRAISLDTRGNNMVDDMESVLHEPLKLIVAHGRATATSHGRSTKSWGTQSLREKLTLVMGIDCL
jgi:hypothetical protein